jgi:hypothetical protein
MTEAQHSMSDSSQHANLHATHAVCSAASHTGTKSCCQAGNGTCSSSSSKRNRSGAMSQAHVLLVQLLLLLLPLCKRAQTQIKP